VFVDVFFGKSVAVVDNLPEGFEEARMGVEAFDEAAYCNAGV
jgi:hypothetical protein